MNGWRPHCVLRSSLHASARSRFWRCRSMFQITRSAWFGLRFTIRIPAIAGCGIKSGLSLDRFRKRPFDANRRELDNSPLLRSANGSCNNHISSSAVSIEQWKIECSTSYDLIISAPSIIRMPMQKGRALWTGRTSPIRFAVIPAAGRLNCRCAVRGSQRVMMRCLNQIGCHPGRRRWKQ